MRNYQIVTISSKQLKSTKILIQFDNRGRFAKFDVLSNNLIKELDEDINTLRNNGYGNFNVVFIPAYLIFNQDKGAFHTLWNSFGICQPPIEEVIPSLKGSKFILFNADDQDIKIEL